jgi:hypothetical protein
VKAGEATPDEKLIVQLVIISNEMAVPAVQTGYTVNARNGMVSETKTAPAIIVRETHPTSLAWYG